MFCDSCGGENRDEAKFCRKCGAALPAPIAEPASGSRATTHAVPIDGDEADTALDLRPAPRPPTEAPAESVLRALAGEFEIQRLLGRGGMGAVWLAREKALDRLVAVKVLPEESSREARGVERFLQEARLAAGLRHPNIVPIHSVRSSEGVHFFTMDFVGGETLEGWGRRRRAEGHEDLDEVNRIFRDVTAAVGHAHRHGVVHRDLKPANVMIEESGHVFVMDFGLAKRRGDAALTSSGLVVGTPRYMSPEQLRGEEATPKSDLYALGLIYFFLLAGKDLVGGESVTAIVAQHLTADFRPVVSAEQAVPAAARSLLLALIEKNPAKRPVSAEEVLSRLAGSRDALPSRPAPPAGSSGPAGTPSPTPPATSPYRKQARDKLRGLLDKLPRKDD